MIVLTVTQNAGDLWYFPAGIPHSLQATATDPNGAEFLLVRHLAVNGTVLYLEDYRSSTAGISAKTLPSWSANLLHLDRHQHSSLHLVDRLAGTYSEGCSSEELRHGNRSLQQYSC